MDNKKTTFKSLADILGDFNSTKDKYISREWQGYAVKLAEELNDKKHISLYMKMSRDIDRNVLEVARSYVKDAEVDSKARLFMWKVKKIREERKKDIGKGNKE